ncbi:MAG TPA: PhzF family phenazine biosynthesis isomerase [Sphingomonas sp.]|nr:PhzF family phenazine biosynthesis isomerase [Sphingomonas sp.]
MTRVPFFHVDAFVHGPFTGNPAGVIQLEAWCDDQTLQAIAAEVNLPATAFAVAAGGTEDHTIRWFSPHAEIALCGHGTLAAGHALIGARDTIRFATRRAGIVTVTRDEDRYALSLPALAAAPRALPESVAALGGAPVETLWHEGGYALIVYENEAAVRALTPDVAALAALGEIQHSATAPGVATDIVSRVFTRGVEDAVTGSAHSVLTPYWSTKLGRTAFSAFQASSRGGHLSCRLDCDRAILSGQCITVIEGGFTL